MDERFDDASSSFTSSDSCADTETEREKRDEENGNRIAIKKIYLFKTYRVQVLVREVHRQSFQVENHLLVVVVVVVVVFYFKEKEVTTNERK